jgi:ribosome-binding protein aMBF1 (putative translation factor)
MESKKRKKLERMGGRVTTAKEFLGLTDAEALIVELRLELAAAVRTRRLAKGITQAELAKAIGSSQSRVAKTEGGDPQASLESLVSAVIAVGGKPKLKVA